MSTWRWGTGGTRAGGQGWTLNGKLQLANTESGQGLKGEEMVASAAASASCVCAYVFPHVLICDDCYGRGKCQANGTRPSYHPRGVFAVLPDHSLMLSLSHTLQCDKADVSVWRGEVCAKGTVKKSWVSPQEKAYCAVWMCNTPAELEAMRSLLGLNQLERQKKSRDSFFQPTLFTESFLWPHHRKAKEREEGLIW